MTKEEALVKALNEARCLAQQGRWAEAGLKYERIIEKIRPKPRAKKK